MAARSRSTVRSASSPNSPSACRDGGSRAPTLTLPASGGGNGRGPAGVTAGGNSREDVMSFSVLVVDDEPDVAEMFRQRFRREARRGTYVLHFAASGEEALDRLANGVRPELIVILSDINMPGMDGLSLL